jgi:hypothetical protein
MIHHRDIDLANIAGLPMSAGNPGAFSLLGLPGRHSRRGDLCDSAVQKIENTTSRIFLCKESQERKKLPIKNGIQPTVRILFEVLSVPAVVKSPDHHP